MSKEGILQKYDYSMTSLVDSIVGNLRGLGAESQVNRLVAGLKQDGIAIDDSMARQLLAMTSGNIQISAIPRVHAKMYTAVSNGKVVSSSLGSSNYGYYSLATDINNQNVNDEINFGLMSKKLRDRMKITQELRLKADQKQDQEQAELNEANRNQHIVFSQLGRRSGQLQYQDTNSQSLQAAYADRNRLESLFQELKNIGERTDAFVPERIFTNRGDFNEVAVRVGGRGKGSRVYRFTATKDVGQTGNSNFLAIDQGKLITPIQFANEHSQTVYTGFTDVNGDRISVLSGQRVKFSAEQATVALLSSIAYEIDAVKKIKAPVEFFLQNYSRANYQLNGGNPISKNLLATAGMNYAKTLLGTNSTAGLLNYNSNQLQRNILTNFISHYGRGNQELSEILKMSGVDLTDPQVLATRNKGLEAIGSVLADFASTNDLGTRKAFLGFGADAQSKFDQTFAGRLFDTLDTLVNGTAGGTFLYADVLHDVIGSQNSYLYQSGLDQKLKAVHTRNFESWLTPTQARVYGGTQAVRRNPLYGINANNVQALNVINAATHGLSRGRSHSNVAAYALLNNPLEFGPADFIGDGEPVFAKVAEGSGSRGGVSDRDLLYRLPNVLPMQYDRTVGDVYSLKLIEDTGVGSLVDQSNLDAYYRLLQQKGIDTASMEAKLNGALADNDGRVVNFYFDAKSKAASIPQRLKNVIGSRPLMDLTLHYQIALEMQANYQDFSTQYIRDLNAHYFAALKFDGAGINRGIFNSNTVTSTYLESLRSRLDAVGQTDKIYKINSSFEFGAIFGGRVKSFLSTDQASALESVLAETKAEFGLGDTDEEKSLLQELTRARIIGRQQTNSAMSGLIGGSTRTTKSQLNVIALGGAFSDYAYANPLYGNETLNFGGQDLNVNALRRGFFDQSTKSIKASLFTQDANLLSDLGDLIGSADSLSGASVNYDADNDRFVMTDTEGNIKQVITSRKEMRVLTNVFQEAGWNPTAGTVTATSNAASLRGENPIENIYKVSVLSGSDVTNEVNVQLNFLRTLVEGGGRRAEALTGLFKAPLTYLHGEVMDGIYGSIEDSVAFSKEGGSTYQDGGSIKDIYSIASVNNLKSYFFDHGASLISEGLFQNHLKFYEQRTNNFGSQVATALLLSFNLDSFGGVDKSTRGQIERTLGSAKDNSFLNMLQIAERVHNSNHSAGDIGRNILSGINKEEFNKFQAPILENINLQLLNDAVSGDLSAGKQLVDTLNDLLKYDVDGVFNYVTNDVRGREVANIAGNVDFMLQMMNNKAFEFRQLALSADSKDSNYQLFSSTMGMDYDQQMNPTEDLKNLVEDFSNTVPYVVFRSFLSGSQSKVPVSSKKSAQLEFQHLVSEPFMGQLDEFKQTGNLEALRQVMGTTLAFMTQSSVSSQVIALKNMAHFDFTDTTHLNNPLLKSQLLGYYTNPATPQGNLKDDRNLYKMFSILNASEQDLTLVKKIVNKNVNSKNYSKLFRDNERLNTIKGLINRNFDDPNNLVDLRTNIAAGLSEIEDRFKILSYKYKADANKILNIEQAEAISGTMQKSGLQRFSFALPSIEFTSSGISVNPSEKVHGFVLSGEDVKVIGEQFGEFQSEISKYVLDIWGGLAPGGDVRTILERVANSKETHFDLSQHQQEKLGKFYKSVSNLRDKTGETFHGRQLEEIMGNKVRLQGGTGVAAASLHAPTEKRRELRAYRLQP